MIFDHLLSYDWLHKCDNPYQLCHHAIEAVQVSPVHKTHADDRHSSKGRDGGLMNGTFENLKKSQDPKKSDDPKRPEDTEKNG